MSSPQTVISFKGCKTRQQFMARFEAWRDEHIDAQLRAYGSDLLVSGDNFAPTEITRMMAEMRGALLEQCDALCDQMLEILRREA
jgi:hypothetical protein